MGSVRNFSESPLSRIIVLLIQVSILHDSLFNVILAHSPADHYRCSHVPPTPERVQYVWLDNVNFSSTHPSDASEQLPLLTNVQAQSQSTEQEFANSNEQRQRPAKLTRRHIFVSRPQKEVATEADLEPDEPEGEARQMGGPENSSELDSKLQLLRRWLKVSQFLEMTGKQSAAAKKVYKLNGEDLVPMQIMVDYDNSVFMLGKKKARLIVETVIPSVVEFFERALWIKRKYTISRFRFARRCPNNTIYYAKEFNMSSAPKSTPYCMERCEDYAVCGELAVPQEHLAACSYCNRTSRLCSTDWKSAGEGVANAQLVLYVSAKHTARCQRDQTVGYAAHCAQDSKTDRPVAGHVNLCPQSISTEAKDLRALLSTVKHELTHVLGFSVSLFAYYRDEQGKPYLDHGQLPGLVSVNPETGYARWSDRVIRRLVRRNWLTAQGPVDREVHLMVTPTVVSEVRRHFNCSTLEGAELEDQGLDGTSMTHLEKRLFENEAMTGTHTQNSVYSRITLAVLQDTGWYVANFSHAEPLEWGKGLGCEFAQKSCKSWIDERRSRRQSIKPFCDRIKGELLQISCSDDLTSKAVCNMRRYPEPLPAIYQNFDRLEGAIGSGNGPPSSSSTTTTTTTNSANYSHQQHSAHFGGSVDLADFCPYIQEFSWQANNVTMRGSKCELGENSVESDRNPALEYYGPQSRCFAHGRRWQQRTCDYKRHWHHFGAGCYRFSCRNKHVNVIVGNHTYPCYYPDQLIHVNQLVGQWLYNGTLVCPNCDRICPGQECESYDKQIIDLILARAHAGQLVGASRKNDDGSMAVLASIFGEAFNMIERDKSEPVDYSEMQRYLPILEEARELVDHSKLMRHTSLLERLKESAPNIFTLPISTATSERLALVCSSAHPSIHDHANLVYLALPLTPLFATLVIFVISVTNSNTLK